MLPTKHQELPHELEAPLARAKKLEWLTASYIVSVIAVMYLALGQSQAMKTAWADDMLGLVSPVSFLLTTRFVRRNANREFPYGYHRAATIGYLTGSAALLIIGTLLFIDGAKALASGERPSIGLAVVFGHPLWAGYLMIAALIWSTLPSYFLGKAKLPFAEQLHDKVLYADADINRADWQMGTATILSIVAIGWGWWWADAAISLVLSGSIILDGYKNLKQAVFDLMNQTPKTVNRQDDDPLVQRVYDLLCGLDWVQAVKLRMREEGHILYGEAFIIARDTQDANLLAKLRQASAAAHGLDWRIKDVVLAVVEELPE
jgi:cation diffusion facilitator family transporter